MTEKQEYLEDFKIHLKSEKNFSQHTIRAYCADVYTFLLVDNVYSPFLKYTLKDL